MMMYSLGSGARIEFFDLACSGLTALVAFVFIGMFYDDPKLAANGAMFQAVVVSAVLGFAFGLYLKYRSELTVLHTILFTAYFVVAMGIFLVGSVAGLACTIADRTDLRWFTFNNNVACIILSLLIGMLLEAKKLGLLKGENRWRNEIGKYLDYKKRLVDPAITSDTSNSNQFLNPYLVIGAGVGTIPVLFQMFTGDRNNAIFFAAPLVMGTIYYINFTTVGPGLVRTFLLRNIENEQGWRFQNKDYAEVQRMRHDFWEASRLMKDYAPAIYEANRRDELAEQQLRKAQRQQQAKYEQKHKNKGKK